MSEAFRVIIIGGSIAGLTLAHCLSQAGIDYIVLEKHHHIYPHLGGFIFIQPNGACILDQLGLHDDVDAVGEAVKVAHVSFAGGGGARHRWPGDLHQRLGFPISMLTRQELLRILYTRLKDKRRVYVNKRVVAIHPHRAGISVSTADGSVYHGDLVVGSDGIHSVARKEMWRLAKSMVDKEHRIPVEYNCVFGTSHSVPGIKPGDQMVRSSKGLTFFVFGGQKDMTGWFVIHKSDQKYMYPHTPRFQQSDAIRLCECLVDAPIWREITFGDIWRRKSTFIMTTLEEAILPMWHYDRVVCIGDSVNKMGPNIAQGANMAIEAAAALANQLHRLLHPKGATRAGEAEIARMLDKFTSVHYRRAKMVNILARFVLRMHAQDGIIPTILGRYLVLRYGCLTRLVLSAVLTRGATLDYVSLSPDKKDLVLYKRHVYPVNLRMMLLMSIFLLLMLWVLRWVVYSYTWDDVSLRAGWAVCR